MLDGKNLFNVGIGLQDSFKSDLGYIMYFCARQLSFNTPKDGSSKHNITNGTETNNQNFCLQSKRIFGKNTIKTKRPNFAA